jgi:hypothetical protein
MVQQGGWGHIILMIKISKIMIRLLAFWSQES